MAPEPAPNPETSSSTEPEKFALPTSSRSTALDRDREAPQVLAAPSPAAPLDEKADEKAVAAVREREAKARLLALRRIEWVAIGIATILLGGAAYSWRSHSDEQEGRKQAIIGSPIERLPGRRAAPQERWREARPAEVKAASQAIKGQLDAFKRGDYEKAATWQSKELRQSFGTVERFRSAIKQQYPAFASYKSVRFGPAGAQADGSTVRIQVALLGSRDERINALYLLVRESGAYRIAGVVTEPPASGAPSQQPEPDAPGAEVV